MVSMRHGAVILAAFLLFAGEAATAQQDKKKKEPPPSKAPIKDLMLRTHKEKGALVFKVRDEESTPEENKKLLEEYTKMLSMKPPLGDEGAWKKRVGSAISAIQDLVDKKGGAVERVRSATECSSCHNAHRVGGNK